MYWGVSTPATLEVVRRHAPLVSCIINMVVTNVTVNVFLALDATSTVVDITGEAGLFVHVASTLLIDLDTSQPKQRDAVCEAMAAAANAGTPRVPGPVAIGTLTHCTALARELLGQGPSAVRGNAPEILALAGNGNGGRGVETADDVAVALGPACDLARSHGCAIAVSGPVDLTTGGEGVIHVQGDSALLTRIANGGCAPGAVVVVFLGTERKEGLDDVSAVVVTHAAYSVAAGRAEARPTDPGSFPPVFLDTLYALKVQDLQNVSVSATSATIIVGGGST